MTTPLDKALSLFGDRLDRLLNESEAAADMQRAVKAIAQSTFQKLDLVSREEFDTQSIVLAKTRAKLEELEKQLNELNQ